MLHKGIGQDLLYSNSCFLASASRFRRAVLHEELLGMKTHQDWVPNSRIHQFCYYRLSQTKTCIPKDKRTKGNNLEQEKTIKSTKHGFKKLHKGREEVGKCLLKGACTPMLT